jgi:hypothetical protein
MEPFYLYGCRHDILGHLLRKRRTGHGSITVKETPKAKRSSGAGISATNLLPPSPFTYQKCGDPSIQFRAHVSAAPLKLQMKKTL